MNKSTDTPRTDEEMWTTDYHHELCNVVNAEFAQHLEREIKDIRAALGDDGRRTHREILELATKASKWREWKDKYIDLRNAHIAEGQDPAGTIWEHADKLHKELTEKTNEVERLKEELKRGARILATIVDALEQAVPWIKGTLNRTTEESNEVARLRQALELIACPKRPDGTYNRGREACELLAKDALKAEIK